GGPGSEAALGRRRRRRRRWRRRWWRWATCRCRNHGAVRAGLRRRRWRWRRRGWRRWRITELIGRAQQVAPAVGLIFQPRVGQALDGNRCRPFVGEVLALQVERQHAPRPGRNVVTDLRVE